MSISAKLSDIRTAISSAYTAVSNMGGTVPALPTLNALPSAIQTIPTGGDVEQYQKVLDRTIVNFSDNTLTSVGDYAFYLCTNLKTVSLPNCSYVGHHAFEGCGSYSYINLPNCLYVGAYAFPNFWTRIASLPKCSYVGDGAFSGCVYLYSVDIPSCSYVGKVAFSGCTNISTLDLPVCSYVGSSAFFSCSKLTSISLPACSYIGGSAFYRCSNLTSISLPVCSYVGSSAFYSCSKLSVIYIGSSNCSLATSYAFYGTSIGSNKGSIFVKSEYYNTYKTSTNWTYFSRRIYSY